MFRARQIKNICFMIILSVLLMGMCPTGTVADSFFASTRSCVVSVDATRTVLRATASVTTRTVAYTQETLPEYETVLTSITPQRRISLRQSSRDCYSLQRMADILFLYFKESGKHAGCLFDEIVSNTVIIRYIHHQDGAKA